MKRIIAIASAIFLVMFFLLPSVLMAQQDEKVEKKVEKKVDGNDASIKALQQFTIRKKSGNKEKIKRVEINGDDVKINGKPAKDFKDEDITVSISKFKDFDNLGKHFDHLRKHFDHLRIMDPGGSINFNFDSKQLPRFLGEDENTAMLGVVTEKSTAGAEIKEIRAESAAERAGLKKGDIITKVDDKKIATPDDLTDAIRSYKPGDKVTVTILRDKKEQKINAELGKWKGVNIKSFTLWGGGRVIDSRPKLGLSVQDTEDGKGVKVIAVKEDGNAGKAGIKKDDIITHINDNAVNSADEVVKIVRENKEADSLMIKLSRNGKTQNFEVKVPKKLKTAEL